MPPDTAKTYESARIEQLQTAVAAATERVARTTGILDGARAALAKAAADLDLAERLYDAAPGDVGQIRVDAREARHTVADAERRLARFGREAEIAEQEARDVAKLLADAELEARKDSLRGRASVAGFKAATAANAVDLVELEQRLRIALAFRDQAFASAYAAAKELSDLGEQTRPLSAVHLVAPLIASRVATDRNRIAPILNWLDHVRNALSSNGAVPAASPVLLESWNSLLDVNTKSRPVSPDDSARLQTELTAYLEERDGIDAGARIESERNKRERELAPPPVVVLPVVKPRSKFGGRPVDRDGPPVTTITRGAGGPNETVEEWEHPRR